MFETLVSICSGQRPTSQSIVEASFATFHLHGTTKLSRMSDLPESSTSPARVEQVESLALPSDDIVDSVASPYVSSSRVRLISCVLVLGVRVSDEVVVFLWNGAPSHPASLRDAALRGISKRWKILFFCTLPSVGVAFLHGEGMGGMSGTAGIQALRKDGRLL